MSYGGYGSSSYGSSSSSSFGGSSGGSYGNDDFGGPSGASQGLTPQQRSQVMQQVSQQVQMSQFSEILQKMSHTCFEKCVPKPGTSLSSSESGCITKCADRFLESLNVVSQTYVQRLQSSQ